MLSQETSAKLSKKRAKKQPLVNTRKKQISLYDCLPGTSSSAQADQAVDSDADTSIDLPKTKRQRKKKSQFVDDEPELSGHERSDTSEEESDDEPTEVGTLKTEVIYISDDDEEYEEPEPLPVLPIEMWELIVKYSLSPDSARVDRWGGNNNIHTFMRLTQTCKMLKFIAVKNVFLLPTINLKKHT